MLRTDVVKRAAGRLTAWRAHAVAVRGRCDSRAS